PGTRGPSAPRDWRALRRTAAPRQRRRAPPASAQSGSRAARARRSARAARAGSPSRRLLQQPRQRFQARERRLLEEDAGRTVLRAHALDEQVVHSAEVPAILVALDSLPEVAVQGERIQVVLQEVL